MNTGPLRWFILLLLFTAPFLSRAQTLSSIGVPAYYPQMGNTLNSPWNNTRFAKISTDGSMMVGEHGSTGNGSRAWKWTNGLWEYLEGPGNSHVTMSHDGQTVALRNAIIGGGDRVYFNGQLIYTSSTDRRIQDITADGSKYLTMRQDWSVPHVYIVERGNGTTWERLPDHPWDDWIGNLNKVMCSANGMTVAGNDHDFPYLWRGGAPMRLGPTLDNDYDTEARAISENGRVVVGYRNYGDDFAATEDPKVAIRWVDGVEHILPSPAGWRKMDAYAVSGDGSVIVGRYLDVDDYYQAFIWRAETGSMRLLDYFRDYFGIDTQFWWLNTADLISGDGKVMVGIGWEPTGENIVWRFEGDEPRITITAPVADEIVEPDTSYTIRFKTPPNVTSVNIHLVKNSLSSGGARTLLASDVPAAGGTFVWQVPAELLSPSTFVVVADADDPSFEEISSRFRVRLPWYLHRVSGTFQNPEYTPFFPEVNAFSFLPQNGAGQVIWPDSYWQDNPAFWYNNGGQDPFYPPGTDYHPLFFSRQYSFSFEPWLAVVKAFGVPGVYSTLEPWTLGGVQWNQPNPEAGIWWNWQLDQSGGVYEGACYGLSMAMLAAFQNPEQFDAKWLPLGRNSDKLADRQVADGPLFEETLGAVHALHLYQLGRLQTAEMDLSRGVSPAPLSATTPRDVVARLKSMFERDDRDRDRFIIFESEMLPPDPQGRPRIGAHAVVPYAMGFEGEEGSDEGLYTIGIIDPNQGPRNPAHDNPTYLYVDTRTDEWWHENENWAGDTGKGLFLSMEVIHAFAPASTTWPHIFPGVGADMPPRDRLSIGIIGTEGAVNGATGELRFAGGIRTETLPGGYIHFPLTGAPSNPEAYHVPAGATYRAEAVPLADGCAGVRVSGGDVTSTFMQTAATALTRQVVELLPEGLHSVSGGGGTFEIMALLFAEPQEFRGIRVTGLKTENPEGLRLVRDTDGFRLTAPAAATTYNLELSRTSPDGLQIFHHVDVPLAAGTTHIFHPAWPTLGGGPTSLAVDLTGDGMADESIPLDNQAPSAAIWTGWDGGRVQLEIEMQQGAPGFRVVALTNRPYQVEISRNLVEWESSGTVPANSWVPLANLPGVTPADRRIFIRIPR
ncbi:MAG TPA: hypothetical protein VG796_14775 [Verrucomicrobiales bacterium]|nr:hypothetical protein [Verrucomicrobiales bacterium]